MGFSSSPVLYPPSSSPPVIGQKRRLFQTFEPKGLSPKRPKILGGFILDEDDSDSEGPLPSVSYGESQEPSQLDNASRISKADLCSIEEPLAGGKTTQNQVESELSPSPGLVPISTCVDKSRPKSLEVNTSSGKKFSILQRSRNAQQSYEQMIAQRSRTAEGRAKKAYYGIDIHQLLDDAKVQRELDEAAAEFRSQNQPIESVEQKSLKCLNLDRQPAASQMWTEKYRAKKFTELVGDERTHRSVLRWLKGWDPIVFPGNAKSKVKMYDNQEQQQHKKIMLLTGPPGLGKTTLAHVCARQAGYEVLEINASDDRSRDVVKGRIKDALGTETVRGVQQVGKARRAGRPVCVVVDEVDGVVSGSGASGGEGGFMRALIDLVQLDQRNPENQQTSTKGKKKEKFRLMRPLILICNDVYAPSLRPLRQSSIAEIVHVRKPAIDKVIVRMKGIFEKEKVDCDNDAVRRLCENVWGLGTRKQNSSGGRGAGDGDIRGVLVQAEWIAHKLRALPDQTSKLTRKWVEEHVVRSTGSYGALGRGGVKEVVERIFIEGAGLPNLPASLSRDDARLVAESKTNPTGIADLRKRSAITALREMIDLAGDHDRLMTECFATYPTQIFQDDTFLSKPDASYEWLYFHDMLSSKVYSGQEWELNPYLSTSACGFHDLFAALDTNPKGWTEEKATSNDADADADCHPFSGLKADFAAYEAEKASRSTLTEMQSKFSAPLLRLFSSVDTMAMDLVPHVNRMLAPDVKPVVVGGSGAMASVASVRKDSEKTCVKNAVRVMHHLSIEFEKVKIESEGMGAHANGGYAFRMEPPIDKLSMFYVTRSSTPTYTSSDPVAAQAAPKAIATAPVRYAVRQVLSQELSKEKVVQANIARQSRAVGLSVSALSTHPVSDVGLDMTTDSNDSDKENNISGFKNIERITAIATATAALASAPASATVLTNISGNVKKDFFGRPISAPSNAVRPMSRGQAQTPTQQQSHHIRRSSSLALSGEDGKSVYDKCDTTNQQRTWVSFHEGYSNAVRKFISLRELMDGF